MQIFNQFTKKHTLEVKPFLMILILMHNSFFKIYLVSILKILKYMYHEKNFLNRNFQLLPFIYCMLFIINELKNTSNFKITQMLLDRI